MALRPNQFPTRDACDMDDPEEHFLWAFAALPGVKGGILILPVSYYRLVSKHLWDLGFRLTEEPTLEWVPPQATDPNWMTSPGRWVAAGSAPKPSPLAAARAAVARMSFQQRAELRQVLESGAVVDSPAGQVAEQLSDEQKTLILEALKGGEQ